MNRPPIATRMHHQRLDARTLSLVRAGVEADVNGIAQMKEAPA
jgi:hypothetical protein